LNLIFFQGDFFIVLNDICGIFHQNLETMNRKLVLLSMILILGVSANAQYKKFNFGLKAAPQVGWMKTNADTYTSNGARLGFGWGFVTEVNFTENHSFGTGFNVLFNGGKLRYPYAIGQDTGIMDRTYKLKSIEIPLTLKMRTNPIGDFQYFGQIGFGTSFLLNAKGEDEFAFNSSVEKDNGNLNNVAFLRESLIIGLGAEYKLEAGTTLGLGLQFNNGFTDILTGKSAVDSSIKEKAFTNFIELNAFVLF